MKLLSASTISPPACQKNGMNVCHEPVPPGCRLMPYSAPASTSLGELGQLVPVRRRLVEAALLGEVGAVVDEPGLDVPRHAVADAVDDRRVPRTLEELRRVDALRRRLEAAERGELAHPRRADEADVGYLAAGDGVTIRSWAASHGTAVTSTLTSGNSSMKSSASTPRLSPSVPIAHTVMSPSVLHLPAGVPSRHGRRSRRGQSPRPRVRRRQRPQGPLHRLPPLKSVSVPFPGAEISRPLCRSTWANGTVPGSPRGLL